MELKKGVFAVYKGKEYVADTEAGTNRVFLFTKDAAEVSNGFVRTSFGDFEKAVGPDDVTSVYQVSPYTIHNGVRAFVETIRDGKAELVCHGSNLIGVADKAGFDQIDRYSFRKFVPLDELGEILVDINPISGTHLPEDLA